jgi:transposase
MKEPADGFTFVCGPTRACRCCRGCGCLLPSSRSSLRGERFGVSVSSASRWSERFRQEGQLAPKPSGGDHTSHRIEAHAELILARYQQEPRIFLRELRDQLAEQGVQTSPSGLSRFFQRHRVTRKKGRRTQLSRSART